MVKVPEGVARYITFTPAVGASSTKCAVTIQVVDAYGKAVAESLVFWVWLSNAATGIGLSSYSDTIAVLAGGGVDILTETVTTVKAILVQTLATGKYILDITEATTADQPKIYVAALIPGGPNFDRIAVSRILTAADFA